MDLNNRVYRYIIIFIIACFIAVPVCAKLNFNSQVEYDNAGESLPLGEEIQIILQIDPGTSNIHDLRIDLVEDEAYIDDDSFEKTTKPAGAPINLTRSGHVFFNDLLESGESITLSFNAYPKTLMKGTINPLSVKLTYTQLGEIIEEWEIVTANTEDSFYHKWVDTKENYDTSGSSSSIMFYGGLVLFIVGILMIVFTLITRKGESSKTEDMLDRCTKDMNNIKDQLKQLHQSVNPDEFELKSDIERISSSIENKIRDIKRLL